jgi:hypothetical protein
MHRLLYLSELSIILLIRCTCAVDEQGGIDSGIF